METELTYIQVTLAFLGVLIHILTKMKKLIDKNIPFNFSIWLKKNMIDTLLSTISIVVMLIVLPEAIPEYWNNLTAFFVGYQTDSMWKELLSSGKRYSNKSINSLGSEDSTI